MMRISSIAAILLVWCIAAAPATPPQADSWFDRAYSDLVAARQKPLDWQHRSDEAELCLMLVHQRGNEKDPALLKGFVPSAATRLGPELAERVELQDWIVARLVTVDAQAKLLLQDPDANETVKEALREIERSGMEILRSDIANYLALRGHYERARSASISPIRDPLNSMSWLALWFEEGGHAHLRDRALRDVHEHVRQHPPSMRNFDLERIADAHASVKMFDAAFDVAAQIADPQGKLSAYATIGDTAMRKGGPSHVPRVLKEARAIKPDRSDESLFKLARLAAQVGDREAFDHFSSHAERHLNNYLYSYAAKHLVAGYAILGLRDAHGRLMDKAIRALSTKEADDKDGEARLAYAASYVFLNEDARISDAIEAAKKLNPRATEDYSFWEIFETYLDHGRIDAARALIDRWVAADHGDRDMYHAHIAWELVRLKDPDAARNEISKLTRPAHPTLLAILARAYARAGRLDDAAKWIDSMEAPLTRAAMNLAIANALLGRDNYYSRIVYPDWDQRH